MFKEPAITIIGVVVAITTFVVFLLGSNFFIPGILLGGLAGWGFLKLVSVSPSKP
jgi:hypothetical protein